VDGLFLSHFDEDHTAGAAKLLVDGDIRVRTLYLPAVNSEKDAEWAPLLQNYQEQGGTVMRWSAGMQMQVGEARFFCLSPNSQTDYASENDASMVLFWSVPGLRILFTGDISMMAEKTLQEASLAADVLKVAHHGSRTSTGEVFLAAVSPQLAVISAQKSVYGHPHPETTERLLAGQIEYRITEQTGAITVYRSRSKTLAWATYGGT
jgi:competence protein ComEC